MSRTAARCHAVLLSLALLAAATGTAASRPRPQDSTTQPSTLPSTQPAPPAVAVRQAQAMVSAFLEGDVAVLRDLATPRLSDLLRDGLLRRLPELAREEHGAVVAFGDGIVRYDRADPSLSVVLVPVFLERGTVSFSLVVTSAGEITGFRISSFNSRGDTVAPPSGVEAASFVEESLQLPDIPRRATLSIPAARHPSPALVIVSRAEPHNRNESLGARHIVRDLAQLLASNSVAALRFEETVAATPPADPLALFPATVTAAEVVAAIDQLRARPDVDARRIYVLGHGLGAAVAARAVAQDSGRSDRDAPPVAGLVLAAAPSRRALDVAVGYADTLAKLDGRILPEEQALIEEAIATRAAVRHAEDVPAPGVHLGATLEDWTLLDDLDAPAQLEAAMKATPQARVLLIHGGRDLQVTAADLATWRQRLAESAESTILVFPELDHVLSTGQGLPSPFDYTRPRPVAGELVLAIAEWIRPGSTTRPATQPASDQAGQVDRS